MTTTPEPSSTAPEGHIFLKGSPEEAPSFLAKSPMPKAGFGDLMAWVVERRETKRQQWQAYKSKRKSRAKPKPIPRHKKAQYQRTYRAKLKAEKASLKGWNPNPALAREKRAAEARRRRYKEMLDRKKGIM